MKITKYIETNVSWRRWAIGILVFKQAIILLFPLFAVSFKTKPKFFKGKKVNWNEV